MKNLLAESEAKYKALLDSSPDGIGISRGGKVIYANKAALEMFGFKTVEEISKGSFLDMVDPRDQAFIQERIEKRLRGEPVEPYFEVKIRRTDGEVRDIEIRTSEIVLNGERLVQGIYRDITERRKIEDALRESERKFRTVLENSLDVIYQVNLKTGKYDYLSPSSKILLGYAPEDFVATTAKGAFAIVYPDDAARVREHLKQLLASAKPGDKMPPIEYRVKHKESGYRWVIDSSSVLFDEQGNPIAIVGTVHDITERRKAEDELWRTRERLQLMFDSVQDGVCVIDTEGRIVDVNPKGLEMYGVSTKEELIGKSTFDLIVPGEQEKAIRELQRVLERGATGLIEHNVVRADGSEYLAELTASVLKDVSGNPTGFVAVLRDITERRKAEDALKESEEKYRALVETAGLAGEGNNDGGTQCGGEGSCRLRQ
jgi:PAS domain S-box-containing protein